MAFRSLNGAAILVKINGVTYPQCKAIQLNIDYGEDTIYGIDSALPQEIRQTRISVQGKIDGMRIKSTSLMTAGIIKTLKNQLQADYITIQIVDRTTQDVLYFIQQAKVTNESFSVGVRKVVDFSFSFKGIMPCQPEDMSYF